MSDQLFDWIDRHIAWIFGAIIVLLITMIVVAVLFGDEKGDAAQHGCTYIITGKTVIPVCH